MHGERNMIRAGYRWDVSAEFPSNSTGVRVAVRKTKRGAARFAETFRKLNRLRSDRTHLRLRHDPLLDDVMNARGRSR